jgi:hypothetical protein
MRKRMSSDFNEPVRFFGRYTWKDLLRLGLPVALVVLLQDMTRIDLSAGLFLLVGGIVGLAWYMWRPYGDSVDVHLYHLLRWVFRVIL